MSLYRNRRPEASNENGIVLVWMAMFLTGLFLIAGLAIDVGYWYLQGSRVQRAADAAAMAAVAKMPDVAAAAAEADKSLAKNGFSDSDDIDFEKEAIATNQFKVVVHKRNINTFFASNVVTNINLKRTAKAEYRLPLPMGSPYNAIGTGPMYKNEMHGRAQGFWNAINGFCSAREDGDLYASYYVANKTPSKTACPATGALGSADKNPEYRAITETDGGYSYIIEVPGAASGRQVALYDAPFHSGQRLVDNKWVGVSADMRLDREHDPNPTVTTIFRLFDTKGTVDDFRDDELVEQTSYGTDDRLNAPLINQWVKPFTANGRVLQAGKKYRLNVYTKFEEANSFGANTYGIQITNGSDFGVCDSRDNESLCPHVYGIRSLSIFTDKTSVTHSNRAEFYLGKVDTTFIGKTLGVELFDPGEGAQEMSLILPNGEKQRVAWNAFPGNMGQPDTRDVDVSGTASLPGRVSNWKLNDRQVSIKTTVPLNYESVLEDPNYSGVDEGIWWKVRYQLSSDPAIERTDRTTWSLKVEDGSPVRLITED